MAVLMTLASSTAACTASDHPEPPPPPSELLLLGTQVTCVTGARTACAGQEAFQVPHDPSILAQAEGASFGLRHGCLVQRDGRALCWGDASEGQLAVTPQAATERHRGRPYRRPFEPAPGAPALRSLDAGWLHTCAVAESGEVLCWGDNSLGQLGRAGDEPHVGPVEGLDIDGPEGEVTALSAGGLHSCALRSDGSVACWGDGSYGQLGQGESSDSITPVAVAGLAAPAAGIAAGAYHTCALLSGGSVACWGDNRFGQVGDGTRTARNLPTPVAELAGAARAVVAGSSFSCALLESGDAQCWGSNELGELGTGHATHPPLAGESPGAPAPPAPVRDLPAKIVTLAAAGNHACARVEGGAVYCWGANDSGQLGDGTVVDRDLPVAWQGRSAELPRPAQPPLEPPLEGLDVSYHSGRVDWQSAVAEGHRFGLTLATAGLDFRDPYLLAHWEGMRQAGLVRGAYHYFVAADDPERQAHAFLSHVVFEPGDLAPVVDIEALGADPPSDLPTRLRIFLSEVEERLDVKPIIYTGPSFWSSNMNAEFGDYPLWIAEYGVDQPKVPAGWERWHLWQWQGNADLPHVSRIVDLDRVHPEVDLGELLIPPDARSTSNE